MQLVHNVSTYQECYSQANMLLSMLYCIHLIKVLRITNETLHTNLITFFYKEIVFIDVKLYVQQVFQYNTEVWQMKFPIRFNVNGINRRLKEI